MSSFAKYLLHARTQRIRDIRVLYFAVGCLNRHQFAVQVFPEANRDDDSREYIADLVGDVEGGRAVTLSSLSLPLCNCLDGLLPHGLSHRDKLLFVKAMCTDLSLELPHLRGLVKHKRISKQVFRDVLLHHTFV